MGRVGTGGRGTAMAGCVVNTRTGMFIKIRAAAHQPADLLRCEEVLAWCQVDALGWHAVLTPEVTSFRQ